MCKTIVVIIFILCTSVSASAENFIQTGTIEHNIEVANKLHKLQFLNIKVSAEFIQQFNRYRNMLLYSSDELYESTAVDIPYWQVGMNHVPVFNQGRYGTCVTFSTASALDAKFFGQDYISHQCSLAVSRKHWQGAKVKKLLKQFQELGVVSHSNCSSQYPDPNMKLSKSEYVILAKKDSLGDLVKSLQFHKITPNLNEVFQSLLLGQRLVISILVDPKNIAGKPINGYPSGYWDIAPETNIEELCGEYYDQCIGHALVVIGYDLINKTLLLRNSWGREAGVLGDYYMSFNYFKMMTIDLQVVG